MSDDHEHDGGEIVLGNDYDDENEEIASLIIVKAVSCLLKDDEGVVIHHEGAGFVVYRNSIQETITVIADDDYLDIEHGRLIWMHYDGSQAPEPGFEEMVFGADVTKH